MSTLRTNALEGMDAKNSITIVAGAGNITTTNVQEGLCKAWCRMGMSTPAYNDSFNLGTITDNGTGDMTFAITNAFSGATFSTSAYRVDNMRQDFSTMQDPDDSSNSAHGDLA